MKFSFFDIDLPMFSQVCGPRNRELLLVVTVFMFQNLLVNVAMAMTLTSSAQLFLYSE